MQLVTAKVEESAGDPEEGDVPDFFLDVELVRFNSKKFFILFIQKYQLQPIHENENDPSKCEIPVEKSPTFF